LKGGELIINKVKVLAAFVLTVLAAIVSTAIMTTDLVDRPEKPDNHMISCELVIHNTGEFSELYADEINLDRGKQPFGLSIDVKHNDLYVYVLAHETAEREVDEYVKWIISYYGAEEIKH